LIKNRGSTGGGTPGKDTNCDESVNDDDQDMNAVEIPRTQQYARAQSDFERNLYYNYFIEPDEYPEEILAVHEPTPYNAWIHLSCAFWTPEISFNAHRTKIFNLENINKQRFPLKCEVCKKINHGACVQCPKEACTLAFHPECARRANLSLEYRYPLSI
jgi:hypothetical protein